MQIQQVELKSEKFDPITGWDKKDEDLLRTWKICWLPVDKRIKKGSIISLVGEEGKRWIVHRIFKENIDISSIKRGWNNNI